MPDVSPATATALGNAGVSSNTPTGNPNLGKDEFMKLLLAQVSQQDPTQPMDNSAFVAQLAQFSQVEQLTDVNSNLETLMLAQASANQTAATGLVGKIASFKSSQIQLQQGQGATITGTLTGNGDNSSGKVTAVITDSTGKVVRTETFDNVAPGDVNLQWDGKSDDGVQEPAGVYSISLSATDKNGKGMAINQTSKGLVTGISFDGGVAQLLVGDMKVKLSDVTEIDQPPSQN